MDRRQQKTRNLVYQAFAKLLHQESYSSITVKEIIDAANIGRSTFYQHFEDKEDLLNQIADDLFNHVFITHGEGESHEHSESLTLKEQLAHFAYHLKNNPLYFDLLTSPASSFFFDHIKKRLIPYFRNSLAFKNKKIPREFLVESAVTSFLSILGYWLKDKMKESPEELESYFEATLGPILL
jgi:AcrR family transcriptional regulator